MLAKFHLQPSDVPGSSGSVASIPCSDRIAPWVIRPLALCGLVILSGKLASKVIPNEWPNICLIDCFYLSSEYLLSIVKRSNKWSTPLITPGVERAVLHQAFTDSYAIGSQSLVLRQAAPWNKIETQILRFYPKHTEWETLGMGPRNVI